MAKIKPSVATTGSSKRSIEEVDGTMENGGTKKSKCDLTKLTKKELRAIVKKFVNYDAIISAKTVESGQCDDEKELRTRFNAMGLFLHLWQTCDYVDGEVTFTKNEIVEKCNLSGDVIEEYMELAEGLEWIDGNDDDNKFTIDFTTVFEALPGYFEWLPSLKSIIGDVPVSLKKDNPFFKLLAAWDEHDATSRPARLQSLSTLAVRYIALESGEIDCGLLRALKDEKFKLSDSFTTVERDLVFYLAVERYKVGAYHVSLDDYDKDNYESSDSEAEDDNEVYAKLEEENAQLVQENARLLEENAKWKETRANLDKEIADLKNKLKKEDEETTRYRKINFDLTKEITETEKTIADTRKLIAERNNVKAIIDAGKGEHDYHTDSKLKAAAERIEAVTTDDPFLVEAKANLQEMIRTVNNMDRLMTKWEQR